MNLTLDNKLIWKTSKNKKLNRELINILIIHLKIET